MGGWVGVGGCVGVGVGVIIKVYRKIQFINE